MLLEAARGDAYAPEDFDGQVGVLDDVPSNEQELVCFLYTWSAASMLNVSAESSIPVVCKHVI